jgi:hypothetical protein
LDDRSHNERLDVRKKKNRESARSKAGSTNGLQGTDYRFNGIDGLLLFHQLTITNKRFQKIVIGIDQRDINFETGRLVADCMF